MIEGQIALIRRELWEHRAIYVMPLVIALLVSLASVTGQVAVSAFDHAVDIGILGATNLGENARSAAITVLMISLSSTFVFAMWILTIFYSLDALYAERKDRSILFWRSIPSWNDSVRQARGAAKRPPPLHPAVAADRREPGVATTAKTSRDCSIANRADINDPLLRAASTITVPIVKPVTILFRWGKLDGSAPVPSGYSEIINPRSRIRSAKRERSSSPGSCTAIRRQRP